MAGQVIGVLGSEGEGLTGVEEGEQSALAGEEGERRMVTDALGDPIKLETVKEARDGEDVQLTLDPVIQQKAEQALAKVGETYSPLGATAIVMDPETSEILAMANWPPVDPGDLEHVSNDDLLNQATGLNYEPGSTFKAFTVSAALEEGLITPQTEFTIHRRSKSANGSSKTPRNTAPRTSPSNRSWRAPRTSARSRSGRRSGRRTTASGSKPSASARRPASSSPVRNTGSCRN